MIFSEIIFYIILFIILYVQIFLLLTFFESKEGLKRSKKKRGRDFFLSTTIIVPCWNEEKSLPRTIESLLKLDYPKDKLDIFIVDDGSIDNTLTVAKHYELNPRIHVFTKENGGKHTALNLGIEHATTDLVGCLDADSYVAKDALRKIVRKFQDKGVHAVIPAIKVSEAKSFLGLIQKAEYNTSVFLRKSFALLNAVQITPGPFSIFRRSVFQELGPYRRAHNTEDMELALRMNANGYRIDNAHRAFVYTNTPSTLSALFHQRVRWSYGYLMNVYDYRRLLFNKRYGNIGLVILPMGIFAMFATIYFIYLIFSSLYGIIAAKALEIQVIGWSESFRFSFTSFDWFTLNTDFGLFLSIFVLGSAIFMVFLGKKLADNSWRPSLDIILFLFFYGYLAFTWTLKGMYNVIVARGKESWR